MQHLNYQNKLKVFFEASLHNKQKQFSFLQSEVKGENKDLVQGWPTWGALDV